MVITISQINRNNQLETENLTDNESDNSFPDLLSREQMVEFDNGDWLSKERNYNRNRVEQRFSELNRQIGELTNIV